MLKTMKETATRFISEFSFIGDASPCYPGASTWLIAPSWSSGLVNTITLNGNSVPGWREKIANHIDASSAYTRDHVFQQNPHVVIRETAKDAGAGCPASPNRKRSGGQFKELISDNYLSIGSLATPGPIGTSARALCDAEASSRVHAAITNKLRTGLLGESVLAGFSAFCQTLRRPFSRGLSLTRRYVRHHARRSSRTQRQINRANARARAAIGGILRLPSLDHLSRQSLLRGVRATRERTVAALNSKFLERAKGDWLTYSFGWNNIMLDIDSLIQAYERRDGVRSEITRVTGYSEVIEESSLIGLVGMSYFTNTMFSKLSSSYKCKYTFGLLTDSISKEYNSVLSQVGFSAESFIPTLWAALPHSWAIDYFVNVDNVLEAWLNRRVKIVYGTFSYLSRRTRLNAYGPTASDSTRYFTCRTVRPGKAERLTYSRVPVWILPAVDLRVTLPFRLPQFANLFAAYHKPKTSH